MFSTIPNILQRSKSQMNNTKKYPNDPMKLSLYTYDDLDLASQCEWCNEYWLTNLTNMIYDEITQVDKQQCQYFIDHCGKILEHTFFGFNPFSAMNIDISVYTAENCGLGHYVFYLRLMMIGTDLNLEDNLCRMHKQQKEMLCKNKYKDKKYIHVHHKVVQYVQKYYLVHCQRQNIYYDPYMFERRMEYLEKLSMFLFMN